MFRCLKPTKWEILYFLNICLHIKHRERVYVSSVSNYIFPCFFYLFVPMSSLNRHQTVKVSSVSDYSIFPCFFNLFVPMTSFKRHLICTPISFNSLSAWVKGKSVSSVTNHPPSDLLVLFSFSLFTHLSQKPFSWPKTDPRKYSANYLVHNHSFLLVCPRWSEVCWENKLFPSIHAPELKYGKQTLFLWFTVFIHLAWHQSARRCIPVHPIAAYSQ